jgi:hypothetical protein
MRSSGGHRLNWPGFWRQTAGDAIEPATVVHPLPLTELGHDHCLTPLGPELEDR